MLNENSRSKENFAPSHTRPLLQKVNALNIFQINIYQYLTFMHKFNNNQVPSIFYDITKKPQYKYPTKFSSNSFCIKKYSIKCCKFSISLRGPKLWNDVFYNEEKNIQSYSFFQNNLKSKLIQIENRNKYF